MSECTFLPNYSSQMKKTLILFLFFLNPGEISILFLLKKKQSLATNLIVAYGYNFHLKN